MSLTIEKIQIEAKIDALQKKIAVSSLTADMAVVNIRQEISPLLELEQIDLDKVEAAVAVLRAAAEQTRQNEKEIERLKKML